MRVDLQIDPTATTNHEFREVRLHIPSVVEPYLLDLNASHLLAKSWVVPQRGMDLVFIAAVIYGIDKAVSRDTADDRWTRELAVTIPVSDFATWEPVGEHFSECLSFLTGDLWNIRFSQLDQPLIRPKPRKRRRRIPAMQGNAVSLFSGGLDSFIGAVDWLTQHGQEKLYLVGHYDRHVHGPASDQKALIPILIRYFPGRFSAIHAQIGLYKKGPDTNFRSRSLLFVALAFYIAERLGPEIPVIIPENGPIALNIPLTPTRRGSCSTRTAHPHFLFLLESILKRVGFEHEIQTPYESKTKGEMVAECRSQQALIAGYSTTVSCAKSGHTVWWQKRTAHGCGRCIPCLFRRAALHTVGLDDEDYGFDVCDQNITADEIKEDLLALASFLRRSPNPRTIARELVSDGPLQLGQLHQSVDVITRMIQETKNFLSAKASARVKHLGGIP